MSISRGLLNFKTFRLLWILVFAICSYLSLMGGWVVKIGGVKIAGLFWDPGMQYIAGAWSVINTGESSYVGHPGAPLLILIASINWLFSHVFSFFSGTSYGSLEAYARVLPFVILTVKLFLGFCIFATATLMSSRMAIALKIHNAKMLELFFLLSFPVWFIATAIFPESLVMIFLAGAYIFLIKYDKNLRNENNFFRLLLIILASICIGGAVSTKIHTTILFLPLPVLICLFRRKITDSIVSLVAVIASTFLFFIPINKTFFIKFWVDYLFGEKSTKLSSGIINSIETVMSEYIHVIFSRSLFFGGATEWYDSGVYLTNVIIALLTFYLFIKIRKSLMQDFPRFLLFIFALLLLPSLIYKSSVHYLAVALVFYLPVFFIYAEKPASTLQKSLFAIFVSIFLILDLAKSRNDLREFKSCKEYYSHLSGGIFYPNSSNHAPRGEKRQCAGNFDLNTFNGDLFPAVLFKAMDY